LIVGDVVARSGSGSERKASVVRSSYERDDEVAVRAALGRFESVPQPKPPRRRQAQCRRMPYKAFETGRTSRLLGGLPLTGHQRALPDKPAAGRAAIRIPQPARPEGLLEEGARSGTSPVRANDPGIPSRSCPRGLTSTSSLRSTSFYLRFQSEVKFATLIAAMPLRVGSTACSGRRPTRSTHHGRAVRQRTGRSSSSASDRTRTPSRWPA
jgi:hypothetical protein